MRTASIVALAAAVLVAGGATARANTLVDIPVPDRHHEITAKWLVRYPDGGPPRAKVLLPDGYDPRRTYPLLVLLIGLQSHYTDWSDAGEGEIAKTAKGFPGIIVMPEGGDGWYADWYNGGAFGIPAWESYTLDEVIPQVLARYRVRPQRRYHALAGVSMGGLGTAYLGGRLPGFFGSVAVISGLVDLAVGPSAGEGAVQTGISDAGAGAAPTDPYAIEGPPGGYYENGHNPVKLAVNLAQSRVFMASGDGTPAPTSGTGMPASDQAEEGAIIHPASSNYAAALRAAGIDVVYQQHAGYHDWGNFRGEFRDAVAWGLFKPVDAHPTSWVNDTVATHGSLWGLAYRFDRPPDRVVRFRRAGRRLSVGTASSRVTITTAGGCVRHVATPAVLVLPRRACVRLRLRARPRRLRTGRATRTRLALVPPVPGAIVRAGRRHAVADASGVAYLRLCAGARLSVRAPTFRVAHLRLRAHGRPRACRG